MRTCTVIKIEDTESHDSNEAREELLACRVCLATDVKLYNLHKNNLSQTFGDLAGTPVSQSDGLPQHICSMCGMLLIKSWTFRNKCRQTHVFLQDILVNRPQITSSYLQSLDRKKFGVLLKKTNVLALGFDTKKGNNTGKEAEQVKQEFNLDFGIQDDDFQNMDEPNQENEDIEYMIVPKCEVYPSEENSKSKIKGEKVKKKETKGSKGKKELDEVNDKPVKRKRIDNIKTEEDIKSFAKMYNVEVVFLTREQQVAEFQARKESDNYISARFKCEECFKGFNNMNAIKRHMAARHNPSAGAYVCDICKSRFKKRSIRSHVRGHGRQFVCKICNVIHKNSTKAKLHHKWHEGFKYECKLCGKNFNIQFTYLKHVRDYHTTVTCDICQQDASGLRGLAAHKTEVHSEMFKCASCEAQFVSEQALARHKELTAPHGCDPCMRYKLCSQCGEEFLNHQLLNEHLEKEHGDKIFKCEECTATYSSEAQLAFHWGRLHKPRPRKPRRKNVEFVCEFCGKSFPKITALIYHQRTHTGEKPFQCAMCSKRFRTKRTLQGHINSHTGARPHQCTLCSKKFKSESQKYKHQHTHKKERRHKCHLCVKQFITPFELKMHIRSVHMKIPWKRRRKNNKVVEKKNEVVEQKNDEVVGQKNNEVVEEKKNVVVEQ